MPKSHFILSPTGISLFLSAAKDDETRRLVNQYTNASKVDGIPLADQQTLVNLIQATQQNLDQSTLAAVPLLSAELNGIIRFYDNQMHHPQDYHQFLCTDTWLGEEAAKLAAAWLRKMTNATVDVYRLKDLQTSDLDCFQSALSELTKWSEETIPEFQKQGYGIIFNLTSGFKSVQGFLQILANFYADETIYIFERSEKLLRIPRLPIQMTPDRVVRERLLQLRRIALDLPVETVAGIPETLLLVIEEQVVGLSVWGELVWNQTKGQLYSEQLHPSPSTLIAFSSTFEKDVHHLQPDRKRLVNERIDQLARHLEGQGKYNVRSLDFKKLVGDPCPPSTHEIDAWADQDARRIYGHYENEKFMLDQLGKALH